MSRLTNLQLFEKSMILELSQVVTFHVSPAIHPRPTDTKTRPSFTFPKTIYLDRFLDENIDTVRAKWDQKKSLTHSAALLEERKNAITHFDVCPDLFRHVSRANVMDAEQRHTAQLEDLFALL